MKTRYFFILILIGLVQNSFAQYRLYEDGVSKYKEKNYEACIKLLTEFLSKPLRDKKFDIDAFYYRALSNSKTGKFNNAISDFEETILLNHPNKGNIYWFMAKCYDNLENYPEAASCYSNALRELSVDQQTKAKLLYERSMVYTKAGNVNFALEDIKKSYQLDPNNAEIRQQLDRLDKTGSVSRSTVQEDTKVANQTKKKEVAPPPVEEKKQEPVVVVPVQTQPKEPTLADLYGNEKRYALVIGNSNYPKNIGVLKNPVNDATDMAEELRRSNFIVDLVTNATYGQMRAAMLRFKEKVDAADRENTVALFYYAGHGLRNEEENFLVPIDASIEFEDDISRYCFPVQKMVLANMERSNSRMNIVILDACRNNPFPSLTRSLGDQGLGEMKKAKGSFIAYATAPGSVAADGSGRNGLYTQELLKAMKKPGLTIERVFKDVRANVLRLSGDKQNTWDSSNITGEFYFKLN
ncbi:MAG: caspase family protein [Chryseolinea sp.]